MENRGVKSVYRAACRAAVYRHLRARSCIDCGKRVSDRAEERGVFLKDNEILSPSVVNLSPPGLSNTDTVLSGYTVLCRFCMRKRCGQTPRLYRARSRARVKAVIEDAKKVGCALCSEKTPVALDFHHLDPTKKDNEVRRCSTQKKAREEIAKCVVLCANCHRKVHAGLLTVP